MADFDENPFAECSVADPFMDPSVQHVANASISQLVDYDPYQSQPIDGLAVIQLTEKSFANSFEIDPNLQPQVKSVLGTPPKAKPVLSTSPKVKPVLRPPPQIEPVLSAPPQGKPSLSTQALLKYQEELERKEQELLRREEEILRAPPRNFRKNNWPPLPKVCCLQPCFYQDIEVDIPLEFQKIVHDLYLIWLFHGCMMMANVLAGLIILNFSIVAVGMLYMLIFTPFSYICWFRPIYKAFRSDSAVNFMVFFFIFFFQFVVTAFQAIGVPGSGTLGFIAAIECFGDSPKGALHGAIALMIACGFACAAVGDLYFISKIHHIYRSSGGSMGKVQQEFTSEFLNNQNVRNMAANTAAAAVDSQINRNEYSQY